MPSFTLFRNSDSLPKNPFNSSLPSLIAVWGLQDRPNKKSKKGISSKNLKASKIREKIIPIVVIIAIVEENINRFIFDFSTACLALNVVEIFFNEK